MPRISTETPLSPSSGTVGASNSIFIQINLDGATVALERLDSMMMPTGDLIENDRFLAITDGTPVPPNLDVNLRVDFDPVGGADPERVELAINGGAMMECRGPNLVPPNGDPCWNEASGFADFMAVTLTGSSGPADYFGNAIDITIDCVGNPACAQETISNITADIDAPIWEFSRCSLCSLGVPMNGFDCLSACDPAPVAPSGNIAMGGQAIWNRAGDADPSSSATFSIRPANELDVVITRGDTGQLVTLNSNRGGLTGAEVPMTCDAGGNCTATFDLLEVASLSASETHQLTVSFSDLAGNLAVADPVRDGIGGGEEMIVALTDTIPPDPVPTVACIGESTTPSSVFTPSTDPRTFDGSGLRRRLRGNRRVQSSRRGCDAGMVGACGRWILGGSRFQL